MIFGVNIQNTLVYNLFASVFM